MEVEKVDIIVKLEKHRSDVTKLIDGLEALDFTDDGRINRNIVNQIVFTLFETVDAFVNTELDIHNLLYRRG